MSNARPGPWRWSWAASMLPAASLISSIVSGMGSTALAQGPAGQPLQANGVGSSFELVFWQSVMASEDRAQYEAYLAQYPQGTFSALARAKIASLTRTAERSAGAAPVPAPPASAPTPALQSPASQTLAATSQPSPDAGALASFPAMAGVSPPAPPVPAAQPAVAAGASNPTMQAMVATMPVPASPPPASSAATSAATGPALLARLAAYSSAQGPGVSPPATAAGAALPVRPELAPLPAVALPAQFCSAEERNRFHDTAYLPTVRLADANNKAAILYLDELQAHYEARVKDRDIAGANAIARDAGAFRPLAEQAYAARSALLGLFDRMMAVPIMSCAPVK